MKKLHHHNLSPLVAVVSIGVLVSSSLLHGAAPLTLNKIGGLAGLNGAEITAYDARTQRLFVTSGDGIEVVDFSDPSAPDFLVTLDPTDEGASDAAVTSVTIFNGILAAAVPGDDEQADGEVYFYSTATLAFLNAVEVGPLPDMVTFTPDGSAVLVANEGEPDDGLSPTVDPPGSVSFIDLSGGVGVASVLDIGFGDFDGQEAALRASGVRIFPGRSASADFEPEYIAVSPDGLTAFVTLQENNAVAKIDLVSLVVTDILPLGLKDHSLPGNEIDANDDGTLVLGSQPVFGMFMPDAIATVDIGGTTYYLTANEGDDRGENERIEDVTLDPAVFPNAATLQTDPEIGRLGISTVDGQLDVDADGEFEKLHSYGARSFSIWDTDGNLVFDSGSTLATVTDAEGVNPDDDRADNKGTEPEGVVVGKIGNRTFAFIGLERADTIAVFDISNPNAAVFEELAFDIGVDDAPEGLVFIPAASSPSGKDLLVVSNEGDDEPPTLAIYEVEVAPQPDLLFLSKGRTGRVVGNDLYSANGRGQTYAPTQRGRTDVLHFAAQNDGNVEDDFQIRGFAAPARLFRLSFLQAGVGNVTALVRTGREIETIAPMSEARYSAVLSRKTRSAVRLGRNISVLNPRAGTGRDVARYRVQFR